MVALPMDKTSVYMKDMALMANFKPHLKYMSMGTARPLCPILFFVYLICPISKINVPQFPAATIQFL